MKKHGFAATIVLGSLFATAGAALATQNSTSGHAVDRANFERSLQGAPHPHGHVVSPEERYTNSTESHARDRANFDAALSAPKLSEPRPFNTAAPTQTNSGPASDF